MEEYNINNINMDDLLNQLYKKTITSQEQTNKEEQIYTACAGGSNIKIQTIFNKKYSLKSTNDIILLLDNNDKNEHLQIKAKCWNISQNIINNGLRKYILNKSAKVNKYKSILENQIFFRYIYISFKQKNIILDMEDMEFKEYSSLADLNMFSLQQTEINKNMKVIGVSKKRCSDKGLYISGNITNPIKVLNRIITFYTKEGKITLRCAKDRKNLINRNSINLIAYGNIDWNNYSGALVRRELELLNSKLSF